ncbi:PREDICTED: probable serine/threonine-protein kinase tsuA [Camelina sativa]|uniref:Probable serine/threonine-protein kinase tsuA n=1 Tax=Camelina sativa TaxID=90675 RepID=A0ABM0VYN8_CAMSA|nr:PREDICTED: probable serine/threonine-protein kinase tsuA [Camelina sativa]
MSLSFCYRGDVRVMSQAKMLPVGIKSESEWQQFKELKSEIGGQYLYLTLTKVEIEAVYKSKVRKLADNSKSGVVSLESTRKRKNVVDTINEVVGKKSKPEGEEKEAGAWSTGNRIADNVNGVDNNPNGLSTEVHREYRVNGVENNSNRVSTEVHREDNDNNTNGLDNNNNGVDNTNNVVSCEGHIVYNVNGVDKNNVGV